MHDAKSLVPTGLHFMGKARRLIALVPRKDFFLRLGATFVAILGIASAVLTITGRHFEFLGSLALAAAALIMSCLLHIRRLIAPLVAVDDVLAFDIDDNLQTRVHCPCDLKLSIEAKQLARHCYAASVTIDPDTFEQFRVKNPYILACMTDHDGEFLGYFDAIPLRETFARPFLQGIVTEEQITHEDVLRFEEAESCKYLFISGTHAGRRSASMLVWALLKYIDQFYGSGRPFVFALAATKAGDELLQRFKLERQTNSTGRIDKYKLYSIALSRQQIARRLAVLPDWTNLCVLNWANNIARVRNGKKPRRPPLPERKAWALGSS
jgi:hypothetical protein